MPVSNRLFFVIAAGWVPWETRYVDVMALVKVIRLHYCVPVRLRCGVSTGPTPSSRRRVHAATQPVLL